MPAPRAHVWRGPRGKAETVQGRWATSSRLLHAPLTHAVKRSSLLGLGLGLGQEVGAGHYTARNGFAWIIPCMQQRR